MGENRMSCNRIWIRIVSDRLFLWKREMELTSVNMEVENAGTTNALRTLGKKAGAITLAGDCLKAILAILLVSLIFGRAFPEQIMLLKLCAERVVYWDIISRFI